MDRNASHPFKLLGMVTFVTTFAVSDHWTSFKMKYKVETVLIQVINLFIRCPPHQARHIYKFDYSDWNASWRLSCVVGNSGINLLLLCTLVRLVAFGYKYGLGNDLRAPNLKNFSRGACPQTPLGCACVHTHHHQYPHNLSYIPPPLQCHSMLLALACPTMFYNCLVACIASPTLY